MACGVDDTTWRTWADPRSALVCEPVRWVRDLRPRWVALEQVPPVLGLWEHFAYLFRRWGYSAWTGVLCAADYGVPQTRERAILMASLDRAAVPPTPTHSRSGAPAGLFGGGLLPWVSMADALGWDGVDRPGKTICGDRSPRWAYPGNETTGWTLHTNRDQRANGDRQTVAADRPAPAVTGKSGGQWVLRSGQSVDGGERAAWEMDEATGTVTSSVDDCRWMLRVNDLPNATERLRLRNNTSPNACARRLDEPAGTLFFGGHLNDVSWVAERLATTVCAVDRIGRPGHKDRSSGGESQFAEQSVRVTIVEAGILQGFRPDYPWQGTKTAQFSQCGNAIPPPWAATIVGALTGREVTHADR
jgi:DNA (cytosine-5)-methyltransferase 1